MPVHHFAPPRGTLSQFTLSSRALRDNLLGDPPDRPIAVYVPAEADGTPLPLLVDLVGFTGSGLKHVGWTIGESVPQRVDRLIDEGKMGPAVVAFPDCYTSLGGNQYIDSLAMGHWATFLIEEMIPALEDRYPIRPGREHRGVFGKSSGGYGAIVHAMRYADTWGAAACHSGDMGFDVVYQRDLPMACDALARHGGVEGFLKHFAEAPKTAGKDLHVMMVLAMAATYDPDPDAPKGIRLPVSPRTCTLIPERWAAWLEHDPAVLVHRPEVQQALRTLRGLYIDVGSRDQYFIHYGTRRVVDALARAEVPHRYEEFDDDHSGVDYRMDTSLPWLYAALTA